MSSLRAKRRERHVVMVVANDITGDSRVQKVALSAAAAGYDVTLLGRSPDDKASKEWHGAARVRRVPVPLNFKTHGVAPRRRGFETQEAPEPRERIADLRARLDAQSRVARILAKPYRAYLWWRIGRIRREIDGNPRRVRPGRRIDWREELPLLLDLDLALGPMIEKLRPDLIHAHDVTTIALAERATILERGRGRDVRFVYDSHEFVAGIPLESARKRKAYSIVEREHIATADAVVTVAPGIADALKARYRLRIDPLVLLNVPEAGAFDPGSPLSVREAAGVDRGVPLVVYSGTIKPQRGVEILVRALARLPTVHCALVARAAKHPEVLRLMALAEELGCADRLHVVGYVEPHEVTSFLRTADAAVHPLLPSGNADRALPNKLFEYLHACVPLVVSDLPEMGSFVRRTGIGQTFPPGDEAALAARLEEVLCDPEPYRERMADAGLRAEFGWEREAERLIELYDELLLPGDADHAPSTHGASFLVGPVDDKPAGDRVRPSPRAVGRGCHALGQSGAPFAERRSGVDSPGTGPAVEAGLGRRRG